MNLEQTLKQAGILSPQMIQSMEILQMSSYELQGFLQQMALENPVLDLEPPKAQELPFNELEGRFQWLEENDRQPLFANQSNTDTPDLDPLSLAGNDGGLEPDLYTHLSRQLDRKYAKSPTYHAAKYLAGCLDDNGYLCDKLSNLAADAGVGLSIMEEGLKLLQTLDPPGVGAENLSQCLVLQLERLGEHDYVIAIARSYLDELSKQKYKVIASEMGITLGDVVTAASKIKNLEPCPGEAFKHYTPTTYIIPDLFVTQQEGELTVTLNSSTVPRLHISSYYKQLCNNTTDPDVKEYLNDKIRQIRFAIRSVSQRDTTLLDCAKRIVVRQEKFFRSSDAPLTPMTHADLAEDLGIHRSTVSRAIREKYLQCCHGLYPLSYFFSRAVGDIGTRSAQSLLKQLIDNEDKAHPLSDQKLSEKMAKYGCHISRRTVAKYRENLGLPFASGRKA
ncbi:MAG: RNA polymerase factor sigma-54 [Oscillospiraceae bacterium]